LELIEIGLQFLPFFDVVEKLLPPKKNSDIWDIVLAFFCFDTSYIDSMRTIIECTVNTRE